ncbi:MAG: ParB N-terminal domain-containing protein [Candidatus Bathyarchaeia archaeon]
MEEIPIDSIVIEGMYDARLEIDEDYLERLINRIKKWGGITEPIKVRRADMKLIDGLHRLEAAKRLKWKKIPADLLDVSEDEALLLAVEFNDRKDLTEIEIGRVFSEFLSRFKGSREEGIKAISAKTGLSRTTIYNYLALYEGLHPELQKKLIRKEAPPSTLLKLVTIPKPVQPMVFERIREVKDEETRETIIKAAKVLPELRAEEAKPSQPRMRGILKSIENWREREDPKIIINRLPIMRALEIDLQSLECGSCGAEIKAIHCPKCGQTLHPYEAKPNLLMIAPRSKLRKALEESLEAMKDLNG